MSAVVSPTAVLVFRSLAEVQAPPLVSRIRLKKMHLPPCPAQRKSFYETLQSTPDLDLRDKRGKRHDLSMVLVGFSLALLSNRDGNLSSIHRHMRRRYAELCQFLGEVPKKVVSRSQLPLILSRVNRGVLEGLIFDFCGASLCEGQKKWFSVDGKELRGSIQKGDKRGEAIVELVFHDNGQIKGQAFYSGKKESEQPAVRDLLKGYGVLDQKISADALHFNPATLNLIHKSGGTYLIGLKDNQAEMLGEMQGVSRRISIGYQQVTTEKGHGRIEKRSYRGIDVRGEYFDPRWGKSGLATLIKIERSRTDTKTLQVSEETAWYMSNQIPENQKQAEELFTAVRKHWSVETTNHVRDVSLKEDRLRTKKTMFQKPPPRLEQ